MPVSPSNPLDIQTAIAVLVAAYLCVAYWRTTLRMILIVVVALAILGAVAGIHGVTSQMVPHH